MKRFATKSTDFFKTSTSTLTSTPEITTSTPEISSPFIIEGFSAAKSLANLAQLSSLTKKPVKKPKKLMESKTVPMPEDTDMDDIDNTMKRLMLSSITRTSRLRLDTRSVESGPCSVAATSKTAAVESLMNNYVVEVLPIKSDIAIFDYSSTDPNFDPPLKQIVGIEFTFLTPAEVENISMYQVKHSRMAVSAENSVYDPRGGTITNHEKCVICSLGWKECPGHFGMIKLPPIPHPMCMKRIAECLTCFCEFCHRLVLKWGQMKTLKINRYKGEHRFNAFLDHAKKTVRCSHCAKPHGKYVITDDKFFKLYKKKSEVKKINIAYDEVVEIINNIREKEFELLGFPDKRSHPSNMIIYNMLVLPPCARPFVESNNSQCHDDLTYKYIEIIKIVNKLEQKGLTEKTKLELMDNLFFHVKTYMDNSRNKARDPGGKRSLKCIKKRLTGKCGQVRQNLQGKRTDFNARTVVSPEANCKIDEVIIPVEFAKKLTFPETVQTFNMDWCQKLVDDDKVNFIIRGKDRRQARFALYTAGFQLQYGDRVRRGGTLIDPDNNVCQRGKFVLCEGDVVIRNESKEMPDGTFEVISREIDNIELPKRKKFLLKIGDIIERQLQNGDWAILNRQPTLHEGSMRAKKIVIRPGKTIRFNLASTQAYNADFDGDEMNLHPCQSYATKAEYATILSTNANFISGQDSKPMIAIKQDAMSGGYKLTMGWVKIDKRTFNDTCCSYEKREWRSSSSRDPKGPWSEGMGKEVDCSIGYIMSKIEHIKKVHRWTGMLDGEVGRIKLEFGEEKIKGWNLSVRGMRTKLKELKVMHVEAKAIDGDSKDANAIKTKYNQVRDEINKIKNLIAVYSDEKQVRQLAEDNLLYSGHSLFSILLPDDFEYSCYNKISRDGKPVVITRGVLISGTLNKAALGSNSGSLIHHLYKDYGCQVASDFVSYYEYFINSWFQREGFSVGLEDCIPKNSDLMERELQKLYLAAKLAMDTEKDIEVLEAKVLALLNDATNVGERIAKESLDPDNNFVSMVMSGAKGSIFNITHITSAIGQQNVEGKRMTKNNGGRTLPHYPRSGLFMNDVDEIPSSGDAMHHIAKLFESRGFVSSSFYKGLKPQESFFLAAGGREGLIDTACKTAKTGYIQRRMLKTLEDLTVGYNGNVVNARGNIVQFCYGGDNFNAAELIKCKSGYECCDIGHVVDRLNGDYEWEHREKA